MVRRRLALSNVNVFVSATVVAFLGSTLCGLGARWAGSHTVAADMAAAVLLLVPGVPSLNAQNDILEGRLWERPGRLGGGDPGIHRGGRVARTGLLGEGR
jgi:uncharacterized membrane protein YjjP (DUF1212 family)